MPVSVLNELQRQMLNRCYYPAAVCSFLAKFRREKVDGHGIHSYFLNNSAEFLNNYAEFFNNHAAVCFSDKIKKGKVEKHQR